MSTRHLLVIKDAAALVAACEEAKTIGLPLTLVRLRRDDEHPDGREGLARIIGGAA